MSGLLTEEDLDAEYLASLGRNQRMGISPTGPLLPANEGRYDNPTTWGALGRDVMTGVGALAEGFSPQSLSRGMVGAMGGVTIPEGARIIEDDAGGRHFLLRDGTVRPIGADDQRHGGLLDLMDIAPMAGVGGGPRGTLGAGARRMTRGADAAAEAPASPAALRAERRAAARAERQHDDAMRAYLDRGEERAPRAARNLPEGEDVLGLRNYDLTQVPDVPQTPLWRYDPTQGRGRGVSARMSDLVSNPDVERQYVEMVRHGRDNLQGREWYNMDPLRFRFIEELGPEEGERAFRAFTQNIAATSPRSNIIDNMRNASHYFVQEATGEPLARNQPRPYGHLAQNLHRRNVETIRGDGWNLQTNPKPASFAENLAGNQVPGTMDAHALMVPAILSRDPRFLGTGLRLPQAGGDFLDLNPAAAYRRGVFTMDEAARRPQLWANMPNANEYAALENWFRRIGEREGMTTAQTQASGWVGGGAVSGLTSPPLPAAEIFNRVVARTARETGQSEQEVLRRMIRRQQALRAIGPDPAGLAARGLLGDDE